MSTLQLLSQSTYGFESTPDGGRKHVQEVNVDPIGVPRYLTAIVASDLNWLSENDREEIWEQASKRLSERSGRNAAPSMTRIFRVTNDLHIELYEPSLTEDNLGLKTWVSSLLLSQRLEYLSSYIPHDHPRFLELGAGTGLVGLAAASLWRHIVSEVVLTDLPDIVMNLEKNIARNMFLLSSSAFQSPTVTCKVLDWSDELDGPSSEDEQFSIIAAADPIYSSEHPQMLTNTVRKWLKPTAESRFILQLPLRDGYTRERDDLKHKLGEFMTIVEQGEDTGYDDWETSDGQLAEVVCWWAIWRLT